MIVATEVGVDGENDVAGAAARAGSQCPFFPSPAKSSRRSPPHRLCPPLCTAPASMTRRCMPTCSLSLAPTCQYCGERSAECRSRGLLTAHARRRVATQNARPRPVGWPEVNIDNRGGGRKCLALSPGPARVVRRQSSSAVDILGQAPRARCGADAYECGVSTPFVPTRRRLIGAFANEWRMAGPVWRDLRTIPARETAWRKGR